MTDRDDHFVLLCRKLNKNSIGSLAKFPPLTHVHTLYVLLWTHGYSAVNVVFCMARDLSNNQIGEVPSLVFEYLTSLKVMYVGFGGSMSHLVEPNTLALLLQQIAKEWFEKTAGWRFLYCRIEESEEIKQVKLAGRDVCCCYLLVFRLLNQIESCVIVV